MLADEVEAVIGVDTHKDTNTAVAVETKTMALAEPHSTATDERGYAALLAYADAHAPGRRAWAIESTAHYGAGLTNYLEACGELVLEVDRPKRPRERGGAKSDEIDAARAARELLGRKHQALPRRGTERSALRVLLRTREMATQQRADSMRSLRSMVITAPEPLRAQLRVLGAAGLIRRCAALRIAGGSNPQAAMLKLAMRGTARRIQGLVAETAELDREIERLVLALCPALLEQPGVGTTTAAELILAYSHRGRLRSEAAFASLAGVAPIPASSGKTVRHRLSRGGDRRLNQAFHFIALSRMRFDERTHAYMERRGAEGKSKSEIRRCLKRYLARSLFRLMEAEMTA